jgi:hypothetical protein
VSRAQGQRRYDLGMAFMTIIPEDDGTDMTYAHCEGCGLYQSLGIPLETPDEVAEKALQEWVSKHQCVEICTNGLLLYGGGEEIYGIPT